MSDNPAPGDPNSAKGQNSYAILWNRDLRLYLAGRLVAALGQQMFAMAVGWELYERTGSALALGLVGLTQMVPMLLFTLPAGHLADNYSRKRIIVLGGIGMALASLGMTLISALAAPVVWIYVCLFVGGATRTFMWAAATSFLPHLVERKVLSRAVAWNASMFQISAIVGPSAAGAFIGLVGHHAAPVYALNAVAALASCVLIGMIRREHTVAVKDPMNLRALLTGFSFVLSKRIVLGIITLDMFAVLLGGAAALLPIYAKDILRAGPTGLGLLQTAMPLGAVLCTFLS